MSNSRLPFPPKGATVLGACLFLTGRQRETDFVYGSFEEDHRLCNLFNRTLLVLLQGYLSF